jgi:hypothetical protein
LEKADDDDHSLERNAVLEMIHQSSTESAILEQVADKLIEQLMETNVRRSAETGPQVAVMTAES